MKPALIFDFGGVLMKTVDYAPRHAWDDRLGLPKGTVEKEVHNEGAWRDAQTGKIELSKYWDDVAGRLKLSAHDVEKLAADFYRGDELDQHLIEFIRQQRNADVTVALLSNDTHELLRPKLAHLGIESLFDPLVISSEIRVMKPDAQAYLSVLERLGRPAEETIFIDDRAENITAAESLGIHGVHYIAGMDLPTILQDILPI
ncbi:MAG: HAD family phosphatase [Aggregatilineales bacterium]